MMKQYLRDRKKKSETATVTGVVLTVAFVREKA